MFEAEAARLSAMLGDWPADELSPLLNIGSSTLEFRTRTQPWIDQLLIAPLVARGVKVIHVDIREGAGIDLRADLFKDEEFARAKALNGRAILLCNILEHVPDPKLFLDRALRLLEPGGLVFVTVPRSYPHHADPIDTMFRPTPQEIAALAPQAELIAGAVVDTGSYGQELKRRPWLITRQLFRAPFPFLGWAKWKRSMGKLYWVGRPYQVSLAVLRKRG